MRLTRRDFATGIAAGIAAPYLIKSANAQGATIKIGMCAPVTGPAAESGGYAIKGAKLALEAVNKAGGILGKQGELIVEDDQTTNPGIVLAFSKLASQPDIVGFLGSIRSTQVHAMAPDVIKLGKPVMIGGTDPKLTHMGNQWLFRFRPNDSYSGRVIAEFGVNTLGKKKWAVLHSTDAFGTAGGNALTGALEKLGCTTFDQGYANQSQDFTPVVLAIKQSGADILGSYFTFENDLGIFARQLRQLGVNIPWVGSPSIVNITALKLAGPALHNTYGVADYAENSSEGSKAFGKIYRDSVKVAPDNQSSWTFDAINVLSAGINKAGSTDPGKIREAILGIKKFPGAEGEYNFDQNGDGLHGYNIVKEREGRHRLRQAHRVQRLTFTRPPR
ncbi:branched-chain amino acid transport system substrate-binding protein [Bradyrhizobium sp. LM2.9]